MEKIIRPDLSSIDFNDSSLMAFFLDGRGVEELTTDLLDKIVRGSLIVTEYHKYDNCRTIYLAALSELN
jgi:hypothetical protein